MFRIGRILVPLLLLGPIVHAQREFRSATRFDPPAESFHAPDSLRVLEDQLKRGQFVEAATQIDSLLRDNPHSITPIDERSVMSVGNWLDLATIRYRKDITAAYSAQFDEAAKKNLDDLREQATSRAEDFYNLARRYRFSSIAPIAYVEAADRAAQIGDAPAASALFSFAQQSGWQPDDEKAATLAVCRILAGESPGDFPAAALKRAAEVAAKMNHYRGTLAHDAIWYMRPDGVGMAKTVPIAADGAFFFAAPRHVIALNENGETLWRYAAPEAWARGLAADRPNERGRGTVYSPAIFSSPAGPQILVVRQPLGAGRDFGIRALRASDGKVLWSSETVNGVDSLSFASNPAVAGRYVYAVAIEFNEQSASLVLVALDLMDGHLLFKCPLGTMLQMRRAREDPPGWDEFWEQTEPAVAGDLVIATPNVGMAAAVGRFDGHLRWTRAYEEKMVIIGRGRTRLFGEPDRLPLPSDSDELLRYRGTPDICGQIVVIAPQDNPSALGLELSSGALLWKDDSAPATTLIGHTATLAIFAGDSVEAIDATTGKNRWHYSPTAPARITGPPVVLNGFVYIPTTDSKTILLNAETGRPARNATAQANLRRLLSSENAKKVLDDAFILRTFAPPAVNPSANIGKQ
ncbi:MAG TPA: PQQ-binding-like beta-propeller repeat protein [Tepidisphaeraceae bacterium]|nr:PQQ-binding-like beta-propeller repeat protein [Tepidisphaeraceae bacterium]